MASGPQPAKHMRIAIIDLGTNTFNLLVAERDAVGTLRVLHSEEVPVFLGKGGIEKGLIATDAVERGLTPMLHSEHESHHWIRNVGWYGTHRPVSAIKKLFDISDPGDEAVWIRRPTFTKPMLVMDIAAASIHPTATRP